MPKLGERCTGAAFINQFLLRQIISYRFNNTKLHMYRQLIWPEMRTKLEFEKPAFSNLSLESSLLIWFLRYGA